MRRSKRSRRLTAAFEVKLAASNLQLLDEIGGASKEDAPFVLDQGQADGCRQVALSATGRTSTHQNTRNSTIETPAREMDKSG